MIINYQKLCEHAFQGLPSRKKEILERRFGLATGEPLTLQAIGDEIGITRERVRQIENDALAWILENRRAKLERAFQYFLDYFDGYGGLREERILLEELGRNKFQNHVLLLLNLGDDFNKFKETEDFYPFWATQIERLKEVKNIIQTIIQEFENRSAPMEIEELSSNITLNLPTPVLVSYIDISKFIFQSPFGHYGLVHWPEIKPRGLKDQAYLVLKREGKPLHFTEIADLIGRLPLVSKRVLPESVHNELIKNDRFVLVGRGVYALTEWGYKPGTVKEILIDILKENKKPLSKDELIQKVLEQRQVKEGTIFLNLQDKELFEKDGEGRYTLKGN